ALQREFAQAEADAKTEKERFTPELTKAAEKLAGTKFASLQAALRVILPSQHRKPGNAERDASRHPLETLQFFGVTPKSQVLEYGPGEGWVTEILAPLLATQGKLYATTTDPKGSREVRATLYAERFALFLDKSPALYGKVQSVVIDPAQPNLALDGAIDVALVFRGVHGMVNSGSLNAWLSTIHTALKKNGVLGIEQHRAKPDAEPLASAKTGYIPEAWLIAQIEAAGFKLAKKSEINANPKDTTVHEGGVWALPPTLRNGEKDRADYLAIGESDRMTLKFTKVSK
ncbi:MAG TPA: hypothetical protein VLC09_12325, partial [Polyangiaceae bacterium]|nr:hypothetical protein [Polyangiaceae bacterium]